MILSELFFKDLVHVFRIVNARFFFLKRNSNIFYTAHVFVQIHFTCHFIFFFTFYISQD